MKSIFIGLLFNNEFDLLSVAVNMYLPHVAGIDIVQSAVTLSGKPKKIMDHNPWTPKVNFTTIYNTSTLFHKKNLEVEKRKILGEMIKSRNPKPQDCIFVPRLEELVNPVVLRQSCNALKQGQTVQFSLMWFYSNFWRLAFTKTWDVKAMTTFQTFQTKFLYDTGSIRTARKDIVKVHANSNKQCHDATRIPIGWRCTMCFRKRIDYVKKLSSSPRKKYILMTKDNTIINNIMCRGHWLDQGTLGTIQHCHSLPNGSETLLSNCAMYNIIPKVSPSLSECLEYKLAPCSRKRLREECTLMKTHLDERNSIWSNYLKTCLL